MKIYLRNQNKFSLNALKFYQQNFDIVKEKEADIIVINDFFPIDSDKIVACNSTATDHISSPEIISLRGEDLSGITAVAELCLGEAILLTRIFKKEEVRGKTIAIIGNGRIGQQLQVYAGNVGMWNLTFDKGELEHNLYNILYKADIVSLHITADESNRNFFTKKMFENMKDGAIFLNSARTWLVEQEGLIWALENKLSGAWFDFNMPFRHPKLITTPHLGGSTKESKEKTELILAKKLLKLYGRK